GGQRLQDGLGLALFRAWPFAGRWQQVAPLGVLLRRKSGRLRHGGGGPAPPPPHSLRLEVAPRPNCSTPSFVASLPSQWTLRTPVARWAGRPGSSPRWVWSGCRPDRALSPGRCPRTGACPGYAVLER